MEVSAIVQNSIARTTGISDVVFGIGGMWLATSRTPDDTEYGYGCGWGVESDYDAVSPNDKGCYWWPIDERGDYET